MPAGISSHDGSGWNGTSRRSAAVVKASAHASFMISAWRGSGSQIFAYQSPYLGRPIAGRPNEIALGDQREAEPIPERSKCGPFLWTFAH